MFAGLNSACVDELGEPIVYTQKDGSSTTLNAIVELNSAEEQLPDGQYLVVFFSQADLGATPLLGERVSARNRNWVVYEVLVDAVDGCNLRLRAI